MSTARKEAIQKNAKARDTKAKAKNIVSKTGKTKIVIEDPLEGGITKTVTRFFDKAAAQTKSSAVTTEIMMAASCWKNGKAVKGGIPLKNALLKELHNKLDTLSGTALANVKKDIKNQQKLFNKKGVQDRLLGKERVKRVYFGGLDYLIEQDKITDKQVQEEGLKKGDYVFTLIDTSAPEKDAKTRQEINEKHTEEHRPALNSKQEDKDAYLYDLTATLKHIQEEIDTFSK